MSLSLWTYLSFSTPFFLTANLPPPGPCNNLDCCFLGVKCRHASMRHHLHHAMCHAMPCHQRYSVSSLTVLFSPHLFCCCLVWCVFAIRCTHSCCPSAVNMADLAGTYAILRVTPGQEGVGEQAAMTSLATRPVNPSWVSRLSTVALCPCHGATGGCSRPPQERNFSTCYANGTGDTLQDMFP